jgi:hypothetical protein
MSNSSQQKTCKPCKNFIPSQTKGRFGDCQKMREQCNGERNTTVNAAFWRNELGGKSFTPDLPRECTKFEER